MKVNVLGVKIDDINMTEALAQIEKWIWNPGKHYVVTPNPEMVVAAQHDELFKKILNNADLSIPDGAGLKFSGRVKNTFAGIDLMEKLVALAAEKGFVVGFLGGRNKVAEKCAECLLKKYPNLKISYISSGGTVNKDGNLQAATSKIPPADLFFIAFGHIKQEKWIANNLEKTPIKIAIGVGGAFDYLSGGLPRAPIWLRHLGLEWLFRLLVQPRRIKRQLALLKYLWLLLKH